MVDQGGRSTIKENRQVLTGETVVVGGVDKHKDVHVAVPSKTAAPLGAAEFPATLGGHKYLLD
jgi:hypothetical protein